jgi:2-polyprenyl-6-methoxyphenol hydroxylase-like FAD-dependent oxidoreductase
MVLLHPAREGIDVHEAESWNRKGDKKEMMDFYKAWCPQVRNLVSYVPDGEVMEWTLHSHKPLPAWAEGKVVLMGDACHPMLPYVGTSTPTNRAKLAQRLTCHHQPKAQPKQQKTPESCNAS